MYGTRDLSMKSLIIAFVPMIGLMTTTLYAQVEVEEPFRLGTVLGQLVLLLTTIAGFVYTVYRENRNRRWDLEDRKRAREELTAHVEEQKHVVETRTEALSQQLQEN